MLYHEQLMCRERAAASFFVREGAGRWAHAQRFATAAMSATPSGRGPTARIDPRPPGKLASSLVMAGLAVMTDMALPAGLGGTNNEPELELSLAVVTIS